MNPICKTCGTYIGKFKKTDVNKVKRYCCKLNIITCNEDEYYKILIEYSRYK